MQTTYVIVTLLAIFVSSTLRAEDISLVQVASIDGNCYQVSPNLPYGSLPDFDSQLSTTWCAESNVHLNLSSTNSVYGSNLAWIFQSKDTRKLSPLGVIYSVYEEVQIDAVNNIWEPRETQVLVAISGIKTCVVAEVPESNSSASTWSQTMALAENIENLNCLN